MLRGYHQCSKEEAAVLASLMYRINYSETKQDISAVLKDILPVDLQKQVPTQDWKREIAKAYNQDSGMSPEDAKIAFLKVILFLFENLIKKYNLVKILKSLSTKNLILSRFFLMNFLF